MKAKTFKVLFFVNKSRIQKNGAAPIWMRITVSGKRENILMKHTVNPDQWDSARQCMKGGGRLASELNLFLETERLKVFQIYRQMELEDEPITSAVLKARFLGVNTNKKTLLAFLKNTIRNAGN